MKDFLITPMRRRERIMTEGEVDEALRGSQVGRLGLCRDSQPYVVPVNFAYEAGRIYLHCAESGMKIDFLQSNPRVCFEIDDHVATIVAPTPCNHDTAYRSVIIFGPARILTSIEEKAAALRLIVSKYSNSEQAGRLTNEAVDRYRSSLGGKTTLVEIAIEQMTGKHYEPDERRAAN